MENNEELVNETENVELTTEEIEDVETPEEEPIEELQEPEESEEERINRLVNEKVDAILPKKLARKEAKIRKEYASKYGKLETVVNAGLGTSDIEEATTKLNDFYKSKGINIPTEPTYSARDLEVLATDDANDIIDGGYDEIVEEVNRLAQKDVNSMTQREKLVFTKLANARKEIEEARELDSIGVNKDILNDEEFKKYVAKLNPSLSLKEKYEMYLEKQPKKEIKQMGSMKSGKTSDVKEYYSDKEIGSLSLDDLDNDEVWNAVRRSMTR
jgi:hypothetical protein